MLKTDEPNAEKSTQIYLDKINISLDTYAPLNRINKYKLQFKSKSWITLDLQKSVSVKKKLLITNYYYKLLISLIKKDPILKEGFHINYKHTEIFYEET